VRLIVLLWARLRLRLALALTVAGQYLIRLGGRLVERSLADLERAHVGDVKTDWLLLAAVALLLVSLAGWLWLER
jgi:hypothetical protein